MLLLTFVISLAMNTQAASAAANCSQMEIVFARGSGQGLSEDEAKRFFKETKERVKTVVSDPVQYELGTEKYGNEQYPAVPVGLDHISTSIGAKISYGYLAEYGASVRSGAVELKTYLEQRYAKCKNQNTKYALGGYSQGAQVIGQTLPFLSKEIREQIIYTAFFGDPKLYLPEGEGLDGIAPACWGVKSPYREEIANCNVDNGSLGARKPYLPDDMVNKAGLWCYDHDYICGVTHNFLDNDGHGKYKDSGRAIDQAAQKIAVKFAQTLPVNRKELVDTQYHVGHGTAGNDVMFIVDLFPTMVSRLPAIKEAIYQQANKVISNGGRASLRAYRAYPVSTTDTRKYELSCGGWTFLEAWYINQHPHNDFSRQAIDTFLWSNPDQTIRVSPLGALDECAVNKQWKPRATKTAILYTDVKSITSPDELGFTKQGIADELLGIDPVNLYPVVPTESVDVFRDLAEMTSGRAIEDTGDTVAATDRAMNDIEHRPVALLKNPEYIAPVGQEITFDASDSYVIDSSITKYEWDFDGDGVFDQTTTQPIVKHTYDTRGDGIMQVRTVAANGTIANASATLKIGTYVPPIKPAMPTNLTATVVSTASNKSTVRLAWQPGDSRANQFAIWMNDMPLGTTEPGRTTVDITDVERTDDIVIRVAGSLADGTIGDSASVTVAKVIAPLSQVNWWQALVNCIVNTLRAIIPQFTW